MHFARIKESYKLQSLTIPFFESIDNQDDTVFFNLFTLHFPKYLYLKDTKA